MCAHQACLSVVSMMMMMMMMKLDDVHGKCVQLACTAAVWKNCSACGSEHVTVQYKQAASCSMLS